MTDPEVLALAGVLLVLPGAVLARLALPRAASWPLLLGVAPAVTLGLTSAAAILGGLTGWRYGPPLAGEVAGAAILLTAVARLLARALRRGVDAPDDVHRPGALVSLLGAAGAVAGVVVGTTTWQTGLRRLATVPQEHDTIHHTAVTAYIWRTGRAAPWQLFPEDVTTGHPVGFYPGGSHAFAALLVGAAGGDPVRALNAASGVILVLGAALALLALGAALPTRWGVLAGGLAALVAATAYRPTYAFLHDGGILANAFASALVPGMIALTVRLPRWGWGGLAPFALGALGLLTVHPTSVPAIAVGVLAWWAGEALTRRGRAWTGWSRRAVAPLLVTAVLTAALAVPTLLAAASRSGQVVSWPRDFPVLTFDKARDYTFTDPYGGFLDPPFHLHQSMLAALTGIGALVLLVTLRGWGAFLALLATEGLLVAYMTVPTTPGLGVLTGLFYNSYVRLQAVPATWTWLAAGAALALPAALVGSACAAVRRWWRRRREAPETDPAALGIIGAALALALAVAAGVAYWNVSGSRYATRNADSLAHRYATPDFVRVDGNDRRAFTYLAAHVRPGQRILNNANDGSSYGYVYDGLPIVNLDPLGEELLPWTYHLLEHVDQIDSSASVRSLMCRHDIAWVEVDAAAPGIGPVGAPDAWVPTDRAYTLPPAFTRLAGRASLTPVFTAGTVTVYRVAGNVLASCRR